MSINISSNFDLFAQLPLLAISVQSDATARDAIPAGKRYEGLRVYLTTTNENWQLQGGITNGDWVLIGSGSGVTGTGSPESIALWSTSTELGANIFFTRSNATSIVFNNQGFTADYNVDVVRYIDAVDGNDANNGTSAGPGGAWLTPAHAIAQCQQMGPGRYIINCAAGTYSAVSFDVPDTISRGLDSSNLLSIIQFEGDQVTPGNVIFENTVGTMIYHASSTTTLRLHGITFQGNVANNTTAILQGSGKIIFRNCVFNNFFTAHNSSGNSEVEVEAPIAFNETYYGFSGTGTYLNVAENVVHTFVAALGQAPSTFNITSGQLLFGFGKVYSLAVPVLSQSGQLILAKDTFINWGTLNQFTGIATECLYDIESCVSLEGPTNRFTANEVLSYCKIKNCEIANNSTAQWWATSFAAEGVKLYGDGIFSSDIVLALGTYPVGLLQDYMTAYVEYQPTPTYTTFGLDNRYLENYGFTCLGELPQGYSLADLGPQGISTAPYYLFVAPYDCEVVSLMVGTRVANGAAHTDTYTLGVNGASSAMAVSITNGDAGQATSPIVDLVSGDVVSIRLTTDAATEAEDVTVQISVRRYG